LIVDRFAVPANEEMFFTNADRSLVTKFMLDKTIYREYDDPESNKANLAEYDIHVGKYTNGNSLWSLRSKISEASLRLPLLHKEQELSYRKQIARQLNKQ